MKYFYIIIILIASSTSFAKEVCMNEEKLNYFQQHIELLLTPKLSIKSNISKITVYTVIRNELNQETQSKSFEIIDTFTNNALSELYFGLSQMDENVYNSEYKQEIFRLIEGVLKSRKAVPVVLSNGNNDLEKLANFVQYHKESK